jgi:uncharacterized protein YecE (DUF72 family)
MTPRRPTIHKKTNMGAIRIGIGGWTYEHWRGTFYPQGLAQKRELEYASRALTSIEINGTYYSTFKPASWRKWRDETPDDFVFAVKASRYVTNRKMLAGAGESVARFLGQGLTELGPKLGPINWQFLATKKFDRDDFDAFLKLLPKELDGVRLRHAVEVRSPTFATPAFTDLARAHSVAIVFATGDGVPEIDEPTADFAYARLMTTHADEPRGMTGADISGYAKRIKTWAARGDVYAYVIAGAKERNPAAAMALMEALA